MKKIFNIEVDCANCANLIEAEIYKMDEIEKAVVNFMTQKLTVEFKEGADIDGVMKKVLKRCKKIEPDCEVEI